MQIVPAVFSFPAPASPDDCLSSVFNYFYIIFEKINAVHVIIKGKTRP
jgi:hypothetical protein